MLQIEYIDNEEIIQIGELFKQLELSDCDEVTNEWPIEIMSFDGYYDVEGFRTVEPQKTIKIETECGIIFEGAYDHILMTHRGWLKLKDLVIGDKLISHNKSPIIKAIYRLDEFKKLYDVQVAICHSFMTNDILSHNSHFLVELGANAMRVGKNVLHYTFELSETNVGLRYDSNLCDIDSSDIQDNKDIVIKRYQDHDLGRLIIKEFPTGSASVLTLRNHIEKLSMKNFIPNVIMVDYADVMRSTRSYDSLRHELKLVYEELRNMAMEMNIPIWTASQAHRDSANSDIVGLENMSEAYGKAMVADAVLSLSRKASEKATGTARLFIAKNRAGKDGVLFPVHIDTARSKITILDENELSLNEAVSQDSSDMKKMLRQKWNELNNTEN